MDVPYKNLILIQEESSRIKNLYERATSKTRQKSIRAHQNIINKFVTTKSADGFWENNIVKRARNL